MTKSIDSIPRSSRGIRLSVDFRPTILILVSKPLSFTLRLAYSRLLVSISSCRQRCSDCLDCIGDCTRADKVPGTLGTAEQWIYAACASSNVKSRKLPAWLLIRCAIHELFQPQDVVVSIWDLPSH